MTPAARLMHYELERATELGRYRYRNYHIVLEVSRVCRAYGLTPTRCKDTAKESACFLVWLALKDMPGFGLSENGVNGIWSRRAPLFALSPQLA